MKGGPSQLNPVFDDGAGARELTTQGAAVVRAGLIWMCLVVPMSDTRAQSVEAQRWGGQRLSEALGLVLPLPEELPPASVRWRQVEWRNAFQVVPPWSAPFSGTLVRYEDGHLELEAKCLVGTSLWNELARLHEAAPTESLEQLLPRLRFREVHLWSRDEPKLRPLANSLETLGLRLAPPDLKVFADGVRYSLRVELRPGRVVLVRGGPEDGSLRDWVEQLREVLGMGPLQ